MTRSRIPTMTRLAQRERKVAIIADFNSGMLRSAIAAKHGLSKVYIRMTIREHLYGAPARNPKVKAHSGLLYLERDRLISKQYSLIEA